MSWQSRVWIGVLVVGLGILPLVFLPEGELAFEVPRVKFGLVWIELLGALTLVLGPGLRLRKPDGFLLAAILGFGAVAGLTAVTGADLAKSMWGNVFREDGWISLLHLIGLSLVVMLVYQDKDRWRRLVAGGIALGSFLVSGWAVVEGVRLHLFKEFAAVPNWQGAIGVSFGQPIFLAGYLLVTWPMAWYLWSRFKGFTKLLAMGAIIIQAVAMVLTGSWAGGLGMVAMVVAREAMAAKQRRVWWGLILAGVVILAGTLWWWRGFQVKGFVAQSRERIFRKVMLGVAERPILGWGWANVDYAFEAGEWPIKLDDDVYVDKAHSTGLEVLATTGVVGLAMYVTIIWGVARGLWRRFKLRGNRGDWEWARTLVFVFGLYLFHSQTNVISFGEEVIFWLVVGMGGGDKRPGSYK